MSYLMSYLRTGCTRTATPQSQPIRADQVKNSAGGYVWAVDQWDPLERFFVLRSETGTYYVGECKLTEMNTENLDRCLKEDGRRVVNTIVGMAVHGRARKHDAYLYALAKACSPKFADEETRSYAFDALVDVARTGTDLFMWAAFVNEFRGWGRGLRNAVSRWYLTPRKHPRRGEALPEWLPMQLVKYKAREGWGHANLLDLAHPNPYNLNFSYSINGVQVLNRAEVDAMLAYSSANSYAGLVKMAKEWVRPPKGKHKVGEHCGTTKDLKRRRKLFAQAAEAVNPANDAPEGAMRLLWAFEKAKTFPPDAHRQQASFITKHHLTREMVPTEWLNSPAVWEALLEHMPMWAMVRNLAKMTVVGLISPLSDGEKMVIGRLMDQKLNQHSQVHPVVFIQALKQYAMGRGEKGKMTWQPSQRICDALDQAVYLAFHANVPKIDENVYVAMDASGSMQDSGVVGIPNMTAAEGSVIMALVMAYACENHYLSAFHETIWQPGISKGDRIDRAMAKIHREPRGTNASLPFQDALQQKIPVDTFVVITDNETWHGDCHPVEALKKYRDKTGRPAKLIAMAMAANQFTICDPNDKGQMNVCGFDAGAVEIIQDFMSGGTVVETTGDEELPG